MRHFKSRHLHPGWALALALVFSAPALGQGRGPGGGGGGGGGGEETAVNNLSFPVLFTGDPLLAIPNDVPMGEYSLNGAFFLIGGNRV